MTDPGPDADLEPFLTDDDRDDEPWPFRHVAFSCDHPGGCDADLDAGDIRADTFAQAMPAAVATARAAGWGVTDDGRISHCPAHTTTTTSLLGLPGTGDA